MVILVNMDEGYSVIIPSYNRPAFLARALKSICSQTIKPKYVYLIIDEPADEVKYSFIHEYKLPLSVSYTGGGYGGAKARNVGLDLCETEYVFFLDDDDEWLGDKIEKQLVIFSKNSEYVGVTCSCFEISRRQSQVVKRNAEHVNNYTKLLNVVGGFSCFGLKLNSETKKLRLRDNLKSAQDYEFYIRVSNLGKIGVESEPLCNFYHHEEARITNTNVCDKEKSLNMVMNYNKHLFNYDEQSFFQAKILLLNVNAQMGFRELYKRFFNGNIKLFRSRQDLALISIVFCKAILLQLRLFVIKLINH